MKPVRGNIDTLIAMEKKLKNVQIVPSPTRQKTMILLSNFCLNNNVYHKFMIEIFLIYRRKNMRFKSNKKITSWLLCIMLIVAMAFSTVGCGTNKQNNNNQETPTEAVVSEESKNNVLGEGQTKFLFTVVDKDGNETIFEIHTDKTTVGDALLDVNLIAGEESEYGLYVKTVNGITADYDVDKTYWAFYTNGEYAMSGVDATVIEDGVEYSFKVEK